MPTSLEPRLVREVEFIACFQIVKSRHIGTRSSMFIHPQTSWPDHSGYQNKEEYARGERALRERCTHAATLHCTGEAPPSRPSEAPGPTGSIPKVSRPWRQGSSQTLAKGFDSPSFILPFTPYWPFWHSLDRRCAIFRSGSGAGIPPCLLEPDPSHAARSPLARP